MLSIQSVVLLLLLATGAVRGAATGSNCGSSSDVIRLVSFQLQPDPVRRPTVANLIINVELKETLVGLIKTVVVLKKKVLMFWIEAPCEDGVGSCTYPDWYSLCPTCVKPLTAGNQVMTMSLNMTTAVPTGDYQAQISFLTEAGQKGCVSITQIQVN